MFQYLGLLLYVCKVLFDMIFLYSYRVTFTHNFDAILSLNSLLYLKYFCSLFVATAVIAANNLLQNKSKTMYFFYVVTVVLIETVTTAHLLVIWSYFLIVLQ